MNLVDIIKYFETKYPKELAYDWDNVGIQVGTLNIVAKKVLVTLDVTKEVVKEAIDKKVNMILSHHPLLFNPLDKIIFDTPRGWIIKNLINRQAELVLDPTLLLSRADWENVASDYLTNNNYILLYMFGNSSTIIKFAEKLADQTGCEIANITYSILKRIKAKHEKSVGPEF